MTPLIGSGLYPFREAGRLVGRPTRTVQRWLDDHHWTYRDGHSYSGPLWRTQFEGRDIPGGPIIGFRDLMELRVVDQLSRHGVSLKVIRALIELASTEFDNPFPLSDRRLLTIGKQLFEQAVQQSTGRDKLSGVSGRPIAFNQMIRESLFSGVDYENGVPARWYPEKRRAVVLDPQISFGTPILTHTGVPTDTIHDAWRAEGKDRAAVARYYELTPEQVSAAVAFEKKLLS